MCCGYGERNRRGRVRTTWIQSQGEINTSLVVLWKCDIRLLLWKRGDNLNNCLTLHYLL